MRNLFRVSADKYTAVAVSTGRDIKSASAASLAAKAKFTTLFVVLIAMLTATLVPLAAAQQKPTEANMFSDAIQDIFCLDAAYFYEPEHYSAMGGSMGLVYASADNVKEYMLDASLPSGETWMGQRHTAYEKYWMSGLSWTVYRGETNPEKTEVTDKWMQPKQTSNRAPEMKDGDPRSPDAMSCFPGVRLATTAAANFIFMGTKMAAGVGGAITAYAFDTSWLQGLNKAAEKAVVGTNGKNGLRDSLYFQFLGLAVFLGSLHLIYVGLIKRRSMETATSALWMVGATWAGSLLMFNPGLIPDLSERIVSEVTSAVLTGTTGTVTAGSSDELCVPSADGDKSDNVIAAVNCNFWRTFAYEPWVLGQFGAPSSELATIDGQEAPEIQLGGEATVKSWPLYQLEAQSIDTYSAAVDKENMMYSKKNSFFHVVDVVSGAEGDGANTYFSTWAGYGFGRVLVAISSLVAALCGLVVVVVFGLSSIAYTLGLAVLVGVSPLFLLIGAHPGTGRRIALEWVELVISTILKRVTLAAMLGLLLMFYSALMTSSTFDTWALQTLGIIAISVAFLIYRGTIMELMGRIDLGGINNFGDNQAGRQMGGVATGVAAGAAGAALGSRGIAAEAAQRRPGQGRLGKAAAVAGAVGGAATKGAVKGGYYGKAGYRPMGQGFRAGQSAASATRGKLAGKNSAAAQQAAALAAQQQKGVQGRNEADNRLNPAKRAAQRSRDEKRNREYARDYNRYKNDKQWREDFKATYGFPPPNPEEKDFMGYGLEPDQLRPHQMPQDKPEETQVDENGNPVPVDIDNEDHSEDGDKNGDNNDSEGGERPRAAAVPVAVPVGAQAPAGEAPSTDSATASPQGQNPDSTRPQTGETTGDTEAAAGTLPSPSADAEGDTAQANSPQQTPRAGSRGGKTHRRVGRGPSHTAAATAQREQAAQAPAPSSHPDANRPQGGTREPQAALPKPEAKSSPAQATQPKSPAQAPQPQAPTRSSSPTRSSAPAQAPQPQAPAQAALPQPEAKSSPARAPQPKSPAQAPQPQTPKPTKSPKKHRRVSVKPPQTLPQPPAEEGKPLPPRNDGGGRPRG